MFLTTRRLGFPFDTLVLDNVITSTLAFTDMYELSLDAVALLFEFKTLCNVFILVTTKMLLFTHSQGTYLSSTVLYTFLDLSLGILVIFNAILHWYLLETLDELVALLTMLISLAVVVLYQCGIALAFGCLLFNAPLETLACGSCYIVCRSAKCFGCCC